MSPSQSHQVPPGPHPDPWRHPHPRMPRELFIPTEMDKELLTALLGDSAEADSIYRILAQQSPPEIAALAVLQLRLFDFLRKVLEQASTISGNGISDYESR